MSYHRTLDGRLIHWNSHVRLHVIDNPINKKYFPMVAKLFIKRFENPDDLCSPYRVEARLVQVLRAPGDPKQWEPHFYNRSLPSQRTRWA